MERGGVSAIELEQMPVEPTGRPGPEQLRSKEQKNTSIWASAPECWNSRGVPETIEVPRQLITESVVLSLRIDIGEDLRLEVRCEAR